MNHSFVIISVAFSLSACAFNSTRTPVGTKHSGMIGAGLISWDDTDTKESFEKDCRQWLKPGIAADEVTGKQKDMELPDRAIYATCFANHMQRVEPGYGQQSAPVAVDINGDGTTDYFQWSGVYIPANIYNAYGIPGYYPPMAGGYPAFGGYANQSMYQFPGGVSTVDGSTMDPRTRIATTAQASAHPATANAAPAKKEKEDVDVNSPWDKRANNDFVTHDELDAVADQVDQNTKDVLRLKKSAPKK